MSYYKICSKCILDTIDDQSISFNSKGICNHCTTYDENLKKFYFGNDKELKKFNEIISKIKEQGKGKKYDALIGLSGGVDSTYVAYLCYKYKLRILAVHLDNGWNSELSVVNIKNILKKTGFDLFTHVIKWSEFKDLQKSYFKAHVVDIEALTDHAIFSVLEKVAIKNKIKYIISGSSITTEGRLPSEWAHHKGDHKNIKSIHKKFGKQKISTFPISNYWIRLLRNKIYKIEVIDLLNYINYNKEKAKKTIQNEFKWRDYGGKHFESIFTRFYQGYILPKKFGIDKRKSHYSTLICANQISREKALLEIQKPIYESDFLLKADIEYFLKKMKFSEEEFEKYLKTTRVSHLEYKSIVHFINKLVLLKKILKKKKIIPIK